ncbi:hypothetical protein [Hydrogenophaga sp. ANAO-22]|uniref:hypothetical protein n=1 Tax=Hydrogenophaga sp. ANAO-22 TaxID=3166645 RepID=UPI0036D2CB94
MNSSINSTLANSIGYFDQDMSLSESDVQEAWRPFQDALATLEVVLQRNRGKQAPVKSYETTVQAMIRPWPELYEVLIFAWGGASPSSPGAYKVAQGIERSKEQCLLFLSNQDFNDQVRHDLVELLDNTFQGHYKKALQRAEAACPDDYIGVRQRMQNHLMWLHDRIALFVEHLPDEQCHIVSVGGKKYFLCIQELERFIRDDA